MFKNIILATQNPHKLQEINFIVEKYNIKFEMPPETFNPQETGQTFEENSYIKAFEAAKMTQNVALADDTGLCVDILNGAPGIYSARYAPTQELKIQRLLNELKDIPQDKCRAKFICVMTLVKPNGEILKQARGEIKGLILKSIKGVNGFGYDPIFYVPKFNKTMAEMTEQEKNTISHRALALNEILKFIKN